MNFLLFFILFSVVFCSFGFNTDNNISKPKHIQLPPLNNTPNEVMGEICCICLESIEYNRDFYLKCCKKSIHHSCLYDYNLTKCPLCRSENSIPPKFSSLFEFEFELELGDDVDLRYDIEAHVLVVECIFLFIFRLFSFIRIKYFR